MTVHAPVLIQPTSSRPARVRSASAIPKATSRTTLRVNAICRTLLLALACCLLPSLSWAQAVMPTPYQTVFDNSGNVVSGACVWTYLAGTTTPATTYADSGLTTANANPIIASSSGRFVAYLTAGQSLKFVYETACTPPAHGSVLQTVDNVIATPSNAGGVDVVGTAGEALLAGNVVYLSDGSGSKTAGQWFKADNTNTYSSTTNPVGMVTAPIASGATGTVRMAGTVSGLSSLSVGVSYYIGTSGAITSTQPAANSRRLGAADTTSTLVLQPEGVPAFSGVLTVNTSANTISSPTQPRCAVSNSTTQSIPNTTVTALTADTEAFDVGAMHSTSVNTSRLTVPTGGAGLYLLSGTISFTANATGTRNLLIYKNGGTLLSQTNYQGMTSSDAFIAPVSVLAVLADGDYVELKANQSSGGSLNVQLVQFFAVKIW